MTVTAQTPPEGLIAEGASLERVSTGYTFLEGPIWHPTERWLLFSDIAESRQYRLMPNGTVESFRHPSNQANGNCFDLEGRVVSCEHATSQLTRHTHEGKMVEVIADRHNGLELNSPNDVICDSKGRIWFTDPAFGRIRADLGRLRAQELGFQGVFRLDPNGTLSLVAQDFEQPNGLCLSADERTLFVNDSWGPTIRAYDVAPDGSLSNSRLWTEVHGMGEGVPDGMKLDLDGRLYCNGPGGVHVFSSEAQPLGLIATPEKSTNFCFGGRGRATLYITASTSLYRIALNTSGAPMIHGA